MHINRLLIILLLNDDIGGIDIHLILEDVIAQVFVVFVLGVDVADNWFHKDEVQEDPETGSPCNNVDNFIS